MNRLIAACLLPAVLSGCVAALSPVETLLGGALGGLGGGGSSTLTLQIDQAHGTLTMGGPPAMTPIGTPITLASPAPLPLPSPTPPPPPPVVVTPAPTSGGPTSVPLPPISAPNPVPVVP